MAAVGAFLVLVASVAVFVSVDSKMVLAFLFSGCALVFLSPLVPRIEGTQSAGPQGVVINIGPRLDLRELPQANRNKPSVGASKSLPSLVAAREQ